MPLACVIRSTRYPLLSHGERLLIVRESPAPEAPKPRLLDRVREAIFFFNDTATTEKTYVAWIRRHIFFHGKRHPTEMGAREITDFLSALAVKDKVAASTQNQALSALLFLYRAVLEQDVPWLDDLVRAKRPERLPVVLTRDEVRAVLDRLHGVPLLMVLLLYGAAPACSNARSFGSRTWTSCRIRSWSGTARGTRTA